MKKRLMIIALFTLAVTFSCQTTDTDCKLSETEISKIKEFFQIHNEEALAGNFEAIVSKYTEDAIRFLPGEELVIGKEAILNSLNKIDAVYTFKDDTKEISGYGNMAYVRSEFWMTLKMNGSPDTINWNGRSLVILKKVENDWKLHRVMAN
jgi:ketosteroid isomerase-like protein